MGIHIAWGVPGRVIYCKAVGVNRAEDTFEADRAFIRLMNDATAKKVYIVVDNTDLIQPTPLQYHFQTRSGAHPRNGGVVVFGNMTLVAEWAARAICTVLRLRYDLADDFDDAVARLHRMDASLEHLALPPFHSVFPDLFTEETHQS